MGGWIIPKVSSATHIGNMRKDLIDEIPGRETVVGVYRARDETYFNTLTANGRLYGFYVDTDGKPPMEYTLFDTDGDGDFEHKSSLENPETPKYLLSSTSE